MTAVLLALPGAGCRTERPDVSAPRTATSWQYQLSGGLDVDVDADLFDVDGIETTAEQVRALTRKGAYVVCYVSAGTREEWRPDASSYPPGTVGRPMDDWPGERWIDIRRVDTILPIIERRLAICRDKGFDAVEFDNVDGYANETGFPLTAADQVRFNRALAEAAHAVGLGAGLKNDPEHAGRLVDDFDFAVVEECVRYDECDAYRPFVDRGKPVYLVEYGLDPDTVCTAARAHGFSAIIKHRDLGPDRTVC